MKNYDDLRLIFAGEEYKTVGSSYGPAVRMEYIIHYVVEGVGYVETNGKTVKVSQGQSFILFPYELAYYYADDKDPWHYVWVNFKGEKADYLISQTSFTQKNRVSPPIDKEVLYPLFKNAVQSYFKSNSFVKSANLDLLLATYTEQFPNEAEKTTKQSDILFLITDYIEGNLHDKLTVQMIADACYISRVQLFRICKNAYCCSPLELLNDLRLKRAQYLLTYTDYSINNIANSVGMNDPLYFSRFFHKQTGMRPTEFRKITTSTVLTKE